MNDIIEYIKTSFKIKMKKIYIEPETNHHGNIDKIP